ncbi:hypothetical protein HKD37_17G047131 [Glycine soja]
MVRKMELWNRARGFAEEAAKRSQATKFTEIIAETTKEIAAQASRYLPQPSIINGVYLHRFGITQELREFVEGITITTFEDFPLQDDTELSDVPAVSNVRQDLTEWQEKHARLVLSTVKEISRLRYEPCPQVMKERKFWRIYFILVNNHIAPNENKYMEGDKLKSSIQVKDHEMTMEPLNTELISNQEVQEVKKETKSSNSSTEQDFDVFKIKQNDGDGGYDDDLDKLMDNSDDEKGKS